MARSAFHPSAEQLPATLPIFPLTGALVLPHAELPLNIFEPRYLNMVIDALKADRMIGMIQPRDEDEGGQAPAVYDIGGAGRITQFAETDDGRILITLTGVARFRVREELATVRGYRRVTADWSDYVGDLDVEPVESTDGTPLTDRLPAFFDLHSIKADFDAIAQTPLNQIVSTLTMVCPFEPAEKQALLEAPDLRARLEMMVTLIDMALVQGSAGNDDSGPAH